jgi:hypothetical protein
MNMVVMRTVALKIPVKVYIVSEPNLNDIYGDHHVSSTKSTGSDQWWSLSEEITKVLCAWRQALAALW